MEYKALDRLYQIQLKNSKDPTWVNKDLYKFLYKKEMYLYVYEKMYLNSINKTKKVSSQILKAKFLTKLENLVLSIRNNHFEFQHLSKIGNKFIIIPHPLSHLVQELLKLILEAIYYSVFIKSKYCSIEEKSCRNIVENFSTNFETSLWFFRNVTQLDQYTINTKVLSILLSRRIYDCRFIQLVIKYLNLISSRTNESKNHILFPILIDIYLSELDFFVKTLEEKYTNLESKWKRRLISIYSHLLKKISVLQKYILENCNPDTIKTLSKRLLILKRQKIHFITYENANPSFKITYSRCYNEWILGINGNIILVEKIKKEIVSFLKNSLKLDVCIEKNTTVAFKNYKSSFLNYNVSIIPVIKKYKFKTYLGKFYYNTMINNKIKLNIPLNSIISQLAVDGFCNLRGIPVTKKAWTVQTDSDIIKTYIKTLHKLTAPYSGLDNQNLIKRIQYIFKHSCVCTLAYKHKCTVKQIYCLYGTKLNLSFKF